MDESYPPNVKDLLVEMKDLSDLMVDLAFAALVLEDRDLAKQLSQLEEKMNLLMYQIRGVAAVVTRKLDEAKHITGILQVAGAAEEIANAVESIADFILRGMEIHPVVFEAIEGADEKIAVLEIKEDSPVVNRKIGELSLPPTRGAWPLALKRGDEWIIPPTKETELRSGDVLICKGSEESLKIIGQLACLKLCCRESKSELKEIRKALAKMRDLVAIMVDMAYSSILFGSREIAQEVREMEIDFDKLDYKIRHEVLKAARKERNLEKLNSILELLRYIARISDAADSIADVALRFEEIHPVFREAFAESQESIGRISIKENSAFANKTLEKLKLWEVMGVYVFMIRRGSRLIVEPPSRFRIKAGDILFVRGMKKEVDKVLEVAEYASSMVQKS
ncbi:MAG: TrkA C-terminal domain-containing protein [Candidatus Hadarchaeales archaeon]